MFVLAYRFRRAMTEQTRHDVYPAQASQLTGSPAKKQPFCRWHYDPAQKRLSCSWSDIEGK
jgi:hypothetical protein